ncbi:MAG: sn-glycerol-3-phosphate ABC transporter ATP-binding protein UgpC [Devosia sp.]|nr:sn-glycerol-3-phosphate ABC transporter ATP-binding protein UgpC [Devosia sp.]
MSELRLSGIHKSFGSVETIKGIDLDIAEGEFVVFVGPSGCGKSTLLRMISGLETVTRGQVFIGGRDVTGVPPARRGTAMVFQSYALFPHMSVADNISFGLRLAGESKPEIARKVAEVASTLQITPLLQRRPKQLSGGQRQRVAIGRAIIRKPGVFLFDEPLSNLDAALRVQMRLEIARLHAKLGATMVYVTHDQVEAMTLADRIVVLNAGRVEQVGSPIELYNEPANRFVAQFIGSPHMNFLRGEVVVAGGARVLSVGAARMPLPDAIAASPGASVTIGLRPEHLAIGGGVPLFEADVGVLERLGNETIAYLDAAGSDEPVAVKVAAANEPKPGTRVEVGMAGGVAHLFDTDGRTVGRLDASLVATGHG